MKLISEKKFNPIIEAIDVVEDVMNLFKILELTRELEALEECLPTYMENIIKTFHVIAFDKGEAVKGKTVYPIISYEVKRDCSGNVLLTITLNVGEMLDSGRHKYGVEYSVLFIDGAFSRRIRFSEHLNLVLRNSEDDVEDDYTALCTSHTEANNMLLSKIGNMIGITVRNNPFITREFLTSMIRNEGEDGENEDVTEYRCWMDSNRDTYARVTSMSIDKNLYHKMWNR